MFGMAYGSLVRIFVIFVFCIGSITKSKFQDETEAMSTASAHLVFVENYLIFSSKCLLSMKFQGQSVELQLLASQDIYATSTLR